MASAVTKPYSNKPPRRLYAGNAKETSIFFLWCRIFQLKLCLLLVFQMNLVLLQTMKANYG